MKKLIITIIALLFLVASTGYADWRYNPFTGKLDWYMGAGDSPTFLTSLTINDADGDSTIVLEFVSDDNSQLSLGSVAYSNLIRTSTAEGLAGTDLRIGLDEALRTLIICDRGDINTDRGLAASAEPAIYIMDAAFTDYLRITHDTIYAKSNFIFEISGRPTFRNVYDRSSGNAVEFDSAANIELVDDNAEQAWMYFEDKYNQTNTAAGGSLLIKSLLTSVGDASSGKGYNFFADFRVDDTNDTSLYNIARYHIAKVHGSDLFDAAGLTDSVTIWTQPANSRLENVIIVLETQFVAAGMTDLDVTVGDAGDNTGILLETMNLTSDAVGLDYSLKGAYWSATTAGAYYTTAAKAWLAYSTAVGANLNTTSAGEVIFYFIYTQY